MSRLPIGIVNLLRGKEPPQGAGLRAAYAKFNGVAALVLGIVALLAWRALRARRAWGGAAMAAVAAGLGPPLLWVFAPDLALVLAVVVLLSCLPLVWRFVSRRRP